MITVEPIVCTIRFYEPGVTDTRRGRYSAVASISYMGREKVFISAVMSKMSLKMSRRFREEIESYLRATGVSEVECIRHGNRKTYTDNGVSWIAGW